MTDVLQFDPADRNNHIYNVSERAILDTFKPEYIVSPTKLTRKHFFVSRIFREMLGYWEALVGHRLPRKEAKTRAKELAGWIRNNWRLPNHGEKQKSVLHVRKSDLIWNTRKAEVFVEIARLLNVETATTSTPKWFQTRTVAIQNILVCMDDEEKNLLDQQVRDIENNGYPDEQKQVYAEKYCTRRLDTAAKAHWLEMGLLSLSVIAYRRTDGKLVVEIHENASTLVGVTDRCFDEEHEGKARELRRVWLDYVRDILDEKSTGPSPLTNADAETIRAGADGFPLLPNSLDVDIINKLKKKDGEKILRNYLKENYRLATGGQTSNVPYTEITKGPEQRKKFIHDEYLPPNFVLRDPHNLKLNEIREFLKFLIQRQRSLSSASVFRFCAVKASRKGSELGATAYPDEIDPNNPPVIKKKPKRQRKMPKGPVNADTNNNGQLTGVADTDAGQKEPEQNAETEAGQVESAQHAETDAGQMEPTIDADVSYADKGGPAIANTGKPTGGADADWTNNTEFVSGLAARADFAFPQIQMPMMDWHEVGDYGNQYGSKLLPDPLGLNPYEPGNDGIDYRVVHTATMPIYSAQHFSLPKNFGDFQFGNSQVPMDINYQMLQAGGVQTQNADMYPSFVDQHTTGFGLTNYWPSRVNEGEMQTQTHTPSKNIHTDQFNFDSIQMSPTYHYQQNNSQRYQAEGAQIHSGQKLGAEYSSDRPTTGPLGPQHVPSNWKEDFEAPKDKQKTKRSHRTADDLAAAEAVVINTKRSRVPKSRDS